MVGNSDFLLALADRLRPLDKPLNVMSAAIEMLGQHLTVDRIGYCDVEEETGILSFPTGWSSGVLEPLSGTLPITFLGDQLVAHFRAGETWVAEDVERDERVPVGAFTPLQTRATIGVPLNRNGAWVAGLFLHQIEPRTWRDAEVVLVQAVLERTWEAVERARAEQALRRSEERQQLLYRLAVQQRQAKDEQSVMSAAAEAIGEYLMADRTGFVVLDDPTEVTFQLGWSQGRAAALAGKMSLADFGASLDPARRGRTIFFTDVRNEPMISAAYEAIDAVSVIGAPILRQGEWRAGLYVHDYKPRSWLADDIALVQEIADAAWDAVERLVAINEIKRSHRQSESKANAFFTLSQDLLVVVEVQEEGEIVIEDINPRTEAIWERTRGEVVGKSLGQVVQPAIAADIERYARECFRLGEPISYMAERHYPARSAYIDVAVAPIKGSRSIMFSARDVSEQRRVEEQLRQSQKMESVGQLTGGLAHDFNNLLTGVTGSLDMLQRRVEQGRVAEVGRYVDAAQGAAKRAAALTHRLLAFSRRQTLEPKTLDANRLVKGMEDLIQRTIGPEITLDVVTAAGLWPVQIDPGQLENALLNLSINARDAMPDGGKLTIETGNRWMDERTARERDVPPGQYISICVSDTGTGMPPDVIAKAFDPFFTTKPIGQGTGLGLSMIYGFARQSGGQVRIYSEVGDGTMVCVYLPRHLGEVEEETTSVQEHASMVQPEQKETVLVVDDEATVRMLITDALDDLGYTAIQATDGAAGLKVLQSKVRVDLLITDVGMPGGLNGRQMADAARVARPNLKVLFITGYAENAVLSHGHLDPGMHVMTKPFAMDVLARRITALLS